MNSKFALALVALVFASGFVACQPPSDGPGEVRKWNGGKGPADKARLGKAQPEKTLSTGPKATGEFVDSAAFILKELDVLQETAHMATSPDAFEKIAQRLVKENGECISQDPPSVQLGQNFNILYSGCKTKAGDASLEWSGESKYTYQPRATSSTVTVDSAMEIKVAGQDETICIKRKTDITKTVGTDQTLTLNSQHSSTPGPCRLTATADEALWKLEFKKLKLELHPSDQQPTRDGLNHWVAAFEAESSAQLTSAKEDRSRTSITLSTGTLEFKLCGPNWVPHGSFTLTDGKQTAVLVTSEKGLTEEGSDKPALPFEGCQAL